MRPTAERTIVHNPSHQVQRSPKAVIDEASGPESVDVWIAECEAFAMNEDQSVSRARAISERLDMHCFAGFDGAATLERCRGGDQSLGHWACSWERCQSLVAAVSDAVDAFQQSLTNSHDHPNAV